jgi:hypothetical protein
MNGAPVKGNIILDGDQQGELRLRTAKADYVNPLKKGAKFEAGFKTSYVSSDNDAKFFNVEGVTSKVDTMKTNHFFYREYNNAAYANYSKEFKKFNVQVGVRGEHTNPPGERRLALCQRLLPAFPQCFLQLQAEGR